MVSRQGKMDLVISHYRGLDGLEALQRQWEEIASALPNCRFFHLWEWYYAYLKCLAPDPHNMHFFLFSQGDVPCALLPFSYVPLKVNGLKLKTLTLPLHSHLPLGDIVCREEAVNFPLFSLLAEYLKKSRIPWDLILLPNLPEDGCALRVITNNPPARLLTKPDGHCDANETTGSYEAFIAGLSKNFRRSLKRSRQYLAELPEVRFLFTDRGTALAKKLEAFIEVEGSGWKGAAGSGTAIKLDDRLRCFYHELVRSFSARRRVLINTLEADGKCIAAQFCLLVGDTLYMLKIGYDEDYRRYGPGKVLLDELIKRCIDDPQIAEVNYSTDTAWHKDWNPKAYQKSRCYLFNATPAGIMVYMMENIYRNIKPLLPGWLARQIARFRRGI